MVVQQVAPFRCFALFSVILHGYLRAMPRLGLLICERRAVKFSRLGKQGRIKRAHRVFVGFQIFDN